MTKYTTAGLKKGGSQVEDLEHYLTSELELAESARLGLKDRWDFAEKVDRNDPSIAGTKILDHWEPTAIPSLSPRVNRIVNVTMSSLTGNSTMVQAIPDDKEQTRADALEEALQVLWDRASFDRKLRMALHTSCICGVAVMRQRMTPQGLRFDFIHPGDFFVAPTYGLDLNNAHLVGHRFYLPRWKVLDMVKSADYNTISEEDCEALPAADPSEPAVGRDASYDKVSTDNSNEKVNDQLELFELIVRLELDGKAERCKVVFSQDGSKLLHKEPYPYSRPWYFDVRLQPDEYGKFWPSGSVAQDIVGLCQLKSAMMNLIATGSMASCSPLTIVTKGTLGKKAKALVLNHIYETPYDLDIKQIPFHFDSGAMPLLIQEIDRLLESATGITDVRLAAERKSGDITATQISAEETAAAQNEGAYPTIVAPSIEDMAAFTQELIVAHMAIFREVYGGSIPEGLYGFAKGKVRWQVTGRKPGNSPHLAVAKVQMLYGMSQQPGSVFDPQLVEPALVDMMQLPINTEGLRKSAGKIAEEKAAIASLAAQSIEGPQAPGVQPGLTQGNGPVEGMGVPA